MTKKKTATQKVSDQPKKRSVIRFEGKTIVLPTLMDIDYSVFKKFQHYIRSWVGLKENKNDEAIKAASEASEELIDTLIEEVAEYTKATKGFSFAQHMNIIWLWAGINMEENNPEKLKKALEELGKLIS